MGSQTSLENIWIQFSVVYFYDFYKGAQSVNHIFLNYLPAYPLRTLIADFSFNKRIYEISMNIPVSKMRSIYKIQ